MAGLLDFLAAFNPAAYQGAQPGAGILVSNPIWQNQTEFPNSGAPATQMPPAVNVPAQPAPMVADQPQLPANAQPAQAPMPMAPQGQSLLQSFTGGTPLSGISDWAANNRNTLLALGAGFAGAPSFGQGMSRAFSNAQAGSYMDAALGKQGQTKQQQNQTMQWLISQGKSPAEAAAIVQNPTALASYLKSPKDQSGEYGLSPVWGTDANGNPALIQLGKDGNPVQPKLPQGFNIARDPIKVDAGTETILLDPQTRQPIGRIPKDISGEARAKEVGKAQGEAQANLPSVLATAEQMQKTIQSVRDDPGRGWGTGGSAVFNALPGTPGRDFAQKVEQLKGQAFLQAFNSLRGGGAISEAEGAKATAAIARLDTFQSEEAFKQALNDLEEVVKAGVAKARTMAGQQGGGAPQGTPSGAQPQGDIKSKYGLE